MTGLTEAIHKDEGGGRRKGGPDAREATMDADLRDQLPQEGSTP